MALSLLILDYYEFKVLYRSWKVFTVLIDPISGLSRKTYFKRNMVANQLFDPFSAPLIFVCALFFFKEPVRFVTPVDTRSFRKLLITAFKNINYLLEQ